jgi:peptide/nickel transport system permease protein
MFSRVIVGARDILTVAPLATLIGVAGGAMLGLVTGYFGGLVDNIVGRLIDAVLALPLLIVARTVRSAVLAERELDYVAAARLRGESALHVMCVEILPNILGPIFVELTVRLGYAIFTVATLSFLGVGLQPPSPDWGLAISENYGLIGGGFWWTVLFDALAIMSLVVAVNLVADGLQTALDA